MISKLYNWVASKVDSITEAQKQIEWQEALDTAVEQIGRIPDLYSETGQQQFRQITSDLKELEAATFGKDEEAERVSRGLLYVLPWAEHMGTETAQELQKLVFGLAADQVALLSTAKEQQFEFEFDLDRHILVAQALLKIDSNLAPKRHELVPDLVEEEEFWRNYFYKIETFKQQLGLPHYLTPKPHYEPQPRPLRTESSQRAAPKTPVNTSIEL